MSNSLVKHTFVREIISRHDIRIFIVVDSILASKISKLNGVVLITCTHILFVLQFINCSVLLKLISLSLPNGLHSQHQQRFIFYIFRRCVY